MYPEIDDYILRLIRESSPDRTVWNIESLRQGKPASWNYIDGCMVTALLSVAEITGDSEYSDFARRFIEHFISEDGSILGYEQKKYNLDDVNEGRVLFELYRTTGDEKFRRAAEVLKAQLGSQPRTDEGSFWHKAIYHDQVWLDGIYMAQVFSALYEKNFGSGDYSDTVKQIETVRARMFSSEKKLYFHGYDSSRSMFWADKSTGCSASFWLRAIGWYSAALIDLIDIIPADKNGRLCEIFSELMDGIAQYADPETGMYYQVVDKAGMPGNYLETSGSSMVAYAMLKGARLNVLTKEYAAKGRKTFDGIVNKYLSFKDGALQLGGICLVAGLGPEDNTRRNGSYEYYISEPVVENDAKGVAPFILCYTEIMRQEKAGE